MSPRYLHVLAYRRAAIEAAIDEERARVHPNWARLATLKKMRLHLKDRLHRLLAMATRTVDGPRRTTVGERRRRLRARSR
ncbi:MAG: YdcH family protein [Hyphomonadaceae bacterium]|nr:YdcH family protein [Hyphomonadaceae bacterium]